MPTSLVDRPGTFRPMLSLTLPVLVEQMLHVLVGFTDLWLTGNFLPGEAYVAAMTLMIYALWLVGNVFGVVRRWLPGSSVRETTRWPIV
jgi:Na+-driven multidrug efflux pump